MAELPTSCAVVETDRTHLGHEEQNLLKALLAPGAQIDSVIPDDASPDELWKTLDTCVRGLSLLEARICKLKPVIGKILLIFEQKPSLYKALGFETYSDFMRDGVYAKLGLHRTSAYEGKLVARDWPQLTPDRYAEIGPKRLNILSKITNGRSPNAELLLETAKHMKVSEFREYAEARKLIDAGETVGAVFTVTTNRARLSLFNEFFNDGRVHSIVGSKDRDRILEAVIQECFGEWISRHEEKQEAKRRKAREEAYAPAV